MIISKITFDELYNHYNVNYSRNKYIKRLAPAK